MKARYMGTHAELNELMKKFTEAAKEANVALITADQQSLMKHDQPLQLYQMKPDDHILTYRIAKGCHAGKEVEDHIVDGFLAEIEHIKKERGLDQMFIVATDPFEGRRVDNATLQNTGITISVDGDQNTGSAASTAGLIPVSFPHREVTEYCGCDFYPTDKGSGRFDAKENFKKFVEKKYKGKKR